MTKYSLELPNGHDIILAEYRGNMQYIVINLYDNIIELSNLSTINGKHLSEKEYDSFEELCKDLDIEENTDLWLTEIGNPREKLSKYLIKEESKTTEEMVAEIIEEVEKESETITEFKQPTISDVFTYDKGGNPNSYEPDDAYESEIELDRIEDKQETKEKESPKNTEIHSTFGAGEMVHTVEPINLSEETVARLSESTAKHIETIFNYPLQVEILDNKEKEENKNKNTEYAMEDKTEYTIDDFNKNVQGVDANVLCKILKIKKALLLVSPPGTGKTTTAIELSKLITGVVKSNRVVLVSFNQSTSYSDIIGGLQNVNGEWELIKGSLADIADKANNDRENIYIYIIDEINRANTESVIGEAMTALAKRGETVYTNIKTELVIPDNLYIIATMNSTDTSVANLDSATLDRFAVYNMPEIKIKASNINSELSQDKKLKDAVNEVINTINKINKELETDVYKSKENKIGLRALYTDYKNIEELLLVIEYDIEPKVYIRMSNLNDTSKQEIKGELELLKRLLKKDLEYEETE